MEDQAGNDPRRKESELRGGPAADELSAVTTKPRRCAWTQSVFTELQLCAKPCSQEAGFGVGLVGQRARPSWSSLTCMVGGRGTITA